MWGVVLRCVLAAADLVLPARCAACHGPAVGAAVPPLHGCRALGVAGRAGSPPWVRGPPPTAMPACWAGARFEGALRLAVTAYKDEGRRDLRDELARLLGAALTAAADDPALRRLLGMGEEVLVVPVPTARASRRRRGDDPVGDLAVAATAAVNVAHNVAAQRSPARPTLGPAGLGPRDRGFVVVPALVHTRRVADQAHLDRVARARQPRRLDDGGCALARGGAAAPPASSSTTSSRPARPSPRRPARCTTPGRGTSSQPRVPRRHRHSLDPALVAHRTSD